MNEPPPAQGVTELPLPSDAGVDDAGLLQIGAVAQLADLSLRTVRHYEEAGLVRPATRTTGGFRLYDQDTVARLLLIKQMKPLGFTPDEMRLLIETRDRLADPSLDPDERNNLLERVALFSAAATEKVRGLREQLATAEEFASTLHDDAIES
jgi:DNA-binding transcriptional MerR regulator